jgi:Fe-S-cluster-containing dehydrogenase component
MKVFIVDPLKCTGGKSCELACSFEKTGKFNPADSRIKIFYFPEQIIFIPTVCMQCRDAYCVQVCPTAALSRDKESNVVYHNDEKCIVCKQCIMACPWGSIKLDHEGAKVIKCDTCGGDPACVKVCTSKALRFEDADDVVTAKQRETAEKYLKIAREMAVGVI